MAKAVPSYQHVAGILLGSYLCCSCFKLMFDWAGGGMPLASRFR